MLHPAQQITQSSTHGQGVFTLNCPSLYPGCIGCILLYAIHTETGRICDFYMINCFVLTSAATDRKFDTNLLRRVVLKHGRSQLEFEFL